MFHLSYHRIPFLRLFIGNILLVLATGCGDSGNSLGGPPSVKRQQLSVQVTGTGTVQSEPAGMNCSSTCTTEFVHGVSVTLSASPGSGFAFTGWTGACTGVNSKCTLSLDQAKNVTATFSRVSNPTIYNLNLEIAGNGAVVSQPVGINCTSTCSSGFDRDTQVTLTATAAANNLFTGWSGACSGSSNSCIVKMSEVRSVKANFALVPSSNVALSVGVTGNGNVQSNPVGINCGSSCAASFPVNTSVVLTATPNASHVFAAWGGACSGSANTCTVSMAQARTVQASFSPIPASTNWQLATRMELNNEFNIIDPKVSTAIGVDTLIAVSSNGDAMLMWEQSDGVPNGSTRKVFFRRYTAGTWQAPAVIPGLSTDSNHVALVRGKLLMDSAGITTWIRDDNMQTRRHSPSTGWGAPFSPTPAMASVNDVTSYAMDAAGNIGVMVSGDEVFTTGNTFNIALSAGANAWGVWARVDNAATGLKSRGAKVALSSNGSALAIWKERNPGDNHYSMKAARFSGTWGTPESIETLTDPVDISEDAEPAVAIDAQGNGIAMWRQGNSLYYNIYRVGTGWTGAVAVDTGFFTTFHTANIQLGMTPDGRAVATWSSNANGVMRALRSMQYSHTSGWGTPVTVDTNLGRTMMLDDSGEAVMVYSKAIGNTAIYHSFARRLTHGANWSAASQLDTEAGEVLRLRFAMNKSGKGVAVWVQNDAANNDIRNSLWSTVLR